MLNTYFLFAFVAKLLFAFFICMFLAGSLCLFIIFLILFIFSFVLFSPVLQSLESPSPLRDWTHCQFYFLLVFLWFDVDLYNITILHGLRMRAHESKWIQIYRAKFPLRFLSPDQYHIIFICNDSNKLFSVIITSFWKPAFLKWTITSFLNL